jgi:hypothetical protein
MHASLLECRGEGERVRRRSETNTSILVITRIRCKNPQLHSFQWPERNELLKFSSPDITIPRQALTSHKSNLPRPCIVASQELKKGMNHQERQRILLQVSQKNLQSNQIYDHHSSRLRLRDSLNLLPKKVPFSEAVCFAESSGPY